MDTFTASILLVQETGTWAIIFISFLNVMGKKKSKLKRKKKQSRGEGVGRKSNLAGKAPWPQSLHTDIFTTVKASFNAGLCKQRDVSAVQKFEADLIPMSSLSPAERPHRVLAKAVSPARQLGGTGWHHIWQNTQQ